MTRLYSLILSLCMMFNITGCAPITDIEQPAQSEIVTETIQAETPKPNSPREDLEIEVAPGVTSTYGLMRVHFIDVGQADSAFIELGNGQTMLIDAGRSGGDVVDYIRNLQYETIDYVVASHPHDDHIGGMATVLNSFNIGKMYMPKQAHTISAFTNMLDVIENKGIDLYTAKVGTNILSSGNINIDVLAPFSESNSNLNNASAVVRITYPIIKQIGKGIGIKVTKNSVAKGLSQTIPVLGGVISGTLNFASMMPMANRLTKTLDDATFSYSTEELETDIIEIENLTMISEESDKGDARIVDKVSDGIKNVGNSISNLFTGKDDNFEKIKKLKELLDMGAITQEEFDTKKAELLDL